MADEQPDAPKEERLSPRERRAQRAAAAGTGKESINWRRYKVHGYIAIAWMLVIAGVVAYEKYGSDCPGHWHAVMDVHVEGTEATFNHPGFTLDGQGTPLSSHMHRGEVQRGQNQIHFEPNPEECIEFGTFLDYVDIDMDGNSLTLDGDHAQANPEIAGTHTENATHQLRAYHKTWGGSWSGISIGRLNDRQLQDGESVLITFGNYTGDELDELKAGVPELDAALRPGFIDDFPLVPVIGITIIAIVALVIWHNLSKKM